MPSSTLEAIVLDDDLRAFLAEEAAYATAELGDTLRDKRTSRDLEQYRARLDTTIALWRAGETGRVESHTGEIAQIVRVLLQEWAEELAYCREGLQDYIAWGEANGRGWGCETREENIARYGAEVDRLTAAITNCERFLELVER